MIVHAELNCMNCGYEMGDVEGERGSRVEEMVFLPAHQGDTLEVDGHGRLRCPRCNGRVLPQGVTPVKRPIDRNHVHEPRITNSVTRGMMW
jgi:DNA-directed RNA polymerase subunit RPC12/RpoP